MKNAIEKAIEGGYEHDLISGLLSDFEKGIYANWNNYCVLLLDPLFWQALGKSLGWPKISAYPRESDNEFETWKMTWLYFIDHLAEGKDPESFFTNLLEHNLMKI